MGHSKAVLLSLDGGKVSCKEVSQPSTADAEKSQLQQRFSRDSDIVVCAKDSPYCKVKNLQSATRTIGDLNLKYAEFNNPSGRSEQMGFTPRIEPFNGPYLESVPEFTSHELRPNDQFLVLGSRGFWEHFGTDKLAKLVQ